MTRIWRARWCMARLVFAMVLLALFAADRPAHLARIGLASLPDADPAARVADLRAQGQFGDALLVAAAGLEWTEGHAREKLLEQERLTREEQASWFRRAREVGMGALTGRGESLERLIGAVGSDLFLVGDVRDLTIEAMNQATTGDSDELIVLLSTAGVITSVAPQIDWAPAVVKAARKAGALGDTFASTLGAALRQGKWADARALINPIGDLARATSPATALRVMPSAASADDLTRLAEFAKSGKQSAAALHAGGKSAADLLLRAERNGEAMVTAAARKGPRGFEFLTGAGRAAIKPHPILGLLKGLWKGNITALAERAVERLSPHGWWIIPLLAAWTFVELLTLWRRLTTPAS
ncbi:MAG: hypothetical protein HEQ23_15020 [Tepidisphaera sp.]